HNAGKMDITEFDVVQKMEDIRNEIDNYIEPSFATISAYGSNGAIVHYEPQKPGDKILPKGFLLLDTGGHYMEGTTDITRTISLGELTDIQKKHYTAVLMGNLRLSDTSFLYGCRGTNLDCIAREPLWKMELDYKHGTGHGVGYLLNVHESPNSFRWRINPTLINSQDAVLEEGMITSDEPGLYIEGEYGIRLENLIMCRKSEENQYGQFMKFEVLTMAPFDRDAIDINMLNDDDRKILNCYHRTVYKNISPYLNDKEREWLENETKDI
ncbi:MAG: M24 family metallopeptidase, partial [Lachnospiraceae bacterium]|nr:M24 family metallopeptidase [Lachnospiraceae bacterium]